MTLTPEQFKNVLQEVVQNELYSIHEKIDKNHSEVMNAVDKLSKDHQDHNDEHVANIDAHDRMQIEIDDCRKKLSLKTAPAFNR